MASSADRPAIWRASARIPETFAERADLEVFWIFRVAHDADCLALSAPLVHMLLFSAANALLVPGRILLVARLANSLARAETLYDMPSSAASRAFLEQRRIAVTFPLVALVTKRTIASTDLDGPDFFASKAFFAHRSILRYWVERYALLIFVILSVFYNTIINIKCQS